MGDVLAAGILGGTVGGAAAASFGSGVEYVFSGATDQAVKATLKWAGGGVVGGALIGAGTARGKMYTGLN